VIEAGIQSFSAAATISCFRIVQIGTLIGGDDSQAIAEGSGTFRQVGGEPRLRRPSEDLTMTRNDDGASSSISYQWERK